MMTQSWRSWCYKLGLASVLALGGAIAAFRDCALAQIVPDATLGAQRSVVTPNAGGGSVDLITGGATRGTNLFHSFGQFSVLTGRGAYFNNSLQIQNIITRVTGGSISNIDGLLRANGRANLFLINPNGIIFGPNASLNIGGSFFASTANSLNFADGTQFSAKTPATNPLLTVSVPIGLQYGVSAGSITNQSTVVNSNNIPVGLQVQSGKTLALVGGNVSLDRWILTAAGGRVELGGLSAAGTVGLNSDGSLSYPEGVQRADVSLTNGAYVDVSAGGGGSIAVNARNLDISGRSQLIAGIGQNLGTVGSKAGDIELRAQGEINIANSLIFNEVEASGMGNAGNIDITAGSLSVTDGAALTTSTVGQGNAGNIDITTGSLSVTKGAQLLSLTQGQGNAGSVNINARDQVSFEGVGLYSDGVNTSVFPSAAFTTVGSGAVGNAGNINITAGSLSVTNGAALDATTYGQGNAGSVNIQASGTASFGGYSTTVRSLVGPSGVGNSGGININTGALFVTNGAELNTSITDQGRGKAGDIVINARDQVSFDGGFAFSRLEQGTVGTGGNISITTGTLLLTGIPSGYAANANTGQVVTATFGQGNAGDVIVNARGAVTLDGRGSDIFSLVAQNRGIGNAGNIIINSNSLSVANGARIVSQTESQGNAGSVTITASGSVSFNGAVDGAASQVLSGVNPGAVGNGGDIDITADSLSVTNGAALNASTAGQGNGGNITFKANTLEAVNGGQVLTTSSSSGKAGNITLNVSDSVTLSGSASRLRASTDANSTGDGGTISIDPIKLTLTDGASVAVNSLGKGNAGNLDIQAGTVTLDGG